MKGTGRLVRSGRKVGGWLGRVYRPRKSPAAPPASRMPRIGLALGGGFARGIAHVGVLQALERHRIPIHAIAGVSAGAMVAAAYASGTSPEEIQQIGCSMRFNHVARWTISRMGLAASERMTPFLLRLLKNYQFEQMRIPLAVVATDLTTGQPAVFRDSGDVLLPIRASCSYPGLYQPVRVNGYFLVDGAMAMEIPAQAVRDLGATHVISVHIAMAGLPSAPRNLFHVVNRCFQILQIRTEPAWRACSDIVIEPDLQGLSWDAFECGEQMVAAGEAATLAVLPQIEAWLSEAPAARSSIEPQALRLTG
jgi:NTE family protein